MKIKTCLKNIEIYIPENPYSSVLFVTVVNEAVEYLYVTAHLAKILPFL